MSSANTHLFPSNARALSTSGECVALCSLLSALSLSRGSSGFFLLMSSCRIGGQHPRDAWSQRDSNHGKTLQHVATVTTKHQISTSANWLCLCVCVCEHMQEWVRTQYSKSVKLIHSLHFGMCVYSHLGTSSHCLCLHLRINILFLICVIMAVPSSPRSWLCSFVAHSTAAATRQPTAAN